MRFPRTIVALCAGFESYREIRDQPLARSLAYLLGLVALLAVLLLGRLIPTALSRGADLAAWVDAHAPAFRIQEGQAISAAPQPQFVRTGDTLFVLDTTGKVSGPDPRAPQGIFVGKDRLTVWMTATNEPGQLPHSKEVSLRGFPDGQVTSAYLLELVHSMLWVAVPLTLLMLVAVASVGCLLQAGFFSLVASLMERSVPVPLQFRQLLNIAIHAVTPAAVLVTAYILLRLEQIDLWLVYLIAYGIFLVGATSACRDRPDPATAPEDDELF